MIFAVAKDEEFNFMYRANIDALRSEGDVVFFSPIWDKELPECDMVYLPGGYPELFADELTANISMRESVKAFAEQGGRVFAECGGFMYLCHAIDDKEMCGVFSFDATMEGARLHLGYREIKNGEREMENGESSTTNHLPCTASSLRGHEFHYSDIVNTEDMNGGITVSTIQFSAQGKAVPTAIYHYRNVVAGYTHWYWAEKGFMNTYSALINV